MHTCPLESHSRLQHVSKEVANLKKKYKRHPSNLRELKMKLLQLTHVDVEIPRLSMEVSQASGRHQVPRYSQSVLLEETLGRPSLHPSASPEMVAQPQILPSPVCTELCEVISCSCQWC